MPNSWTIKTNDSRLMLAVIGEPGPQPAQPVLDEKVSRLAPRCPSTRGSISPIGSSSSLVPPVPPICASQATSTSPAVSIVSSRSTSLPLGSQSLYLDPNRSAWDACSLGLGFDQPLDVREASDMPATVLDQHRQAGYVLEGSWSWKHTNERDWIGKMRCFWKRRKTLSGGGIQDRTSS